MPRSKHGMRLQATQKELQHSQGALEASHMKLSSLKNHATEQEAAITELQNTLNSKETLLNTISMAACES